MVNVTILSGRLTADPRVTKTKNDKTVASFTVAVARPYKNEDGSYPSDFFDCTAWDASADFVGKYFKQGSPIEITGSLRNDVWTTKDGTTKYGVEVAVDRVNFPITARPREKDEATAPEDAERPEE